MNRDTAAWNALVAEVRRSGAEVIEKDNSFVMHAYYWVAFMWIWNRDFFTKYATAMISGVYVPKAWWGTETGWKVLAHEIVHIHRKNQNPFWYVLRYGFPQILAPLGLLGFLGLAWWPLYALFVLIPIFLLPLFRARGRIDEELHAYAVSVACDNFVFTEHGIVVREGTAPAYVSSLLGAGYFWPAGWIGRAKEEDVVADLRQRAFLVGVESPSFLIATQTWRNFR